MGNNITDLVEFLEPTEEEPEVNEETGEEVKSEETEDETAKPAEEDETKPAEDKTKEEDTKPTDEDKKPEEEETATPGKKEGLSLEEQNRELRQILRNQSKDLKILKSKLDRFEKRSVKKVEDNKDTPDKLLFGEEDDDETPAKEEELSDIEVAQMQLTEIAKVRGGVLEVLLETMEMNPKYEDVREVCSQNNFSDIFAAVGESLAEKEGADPTVAAMEAEVAVWKMPNPYKYMYNLIKKYHPNYTETETTAKKPAAKKLPAKAPASIANVPGESQPDNKWTAARIDEMPEEELHKVPEDIYEKYLAGDLD